MSRAPRTSERGQVLALFAFALAGLILGAAVVVDGGYAFAQRRATQNAADFAAIAGTRILGEKLTKRPAGAGTVANVKGAIEAVLDAHGAELVSAHFVGASGASMADIETATTIPNGTFGVVVEARSNWRPFLLGVIGVIDWEASTVATAKTPGRSIGGGVLPVGIKDDTYDSLIDCPVTELHDCITQNLTPGVHNIPGGFGWLSFGLDGGGQRCQWGSSLGMAADGSCNDNQPFLQSQIGPPANSHGCCTAVGLGGEDKIGSFTGNSWGDLSYYLEEQIPVWVPIWDVAVDEGSHGYYHIVGFGAIVFTDQGTQHAKWLTGASVADSCPDGSEIEGHDFCSIPGGAFTVDMTGEVRLVR